MAHPMDCIPNAWIAIATACDATTQTDGNPSDNQHQMYNRLAEDVDGVCKELIWMRRT